MPANVEELLEIELEVRAPATGVSACVVLRVPPGTAFGDVECELRAAVQPGGVAGKSAEGGRWSIAGPDGHGRPVDVRASLGTGPLRRGALLLLDAAAPSAPPAVCEVHVVGGPATGTVLPLELGQVLLGRHNGDSGGIDDPRVSRTHCCLEVGSAEVRVHDLDSRNGTLLDGKPVLPGGAGTPWPPGAVLQVGDSRLRLALPPARPLPVEQRPDGRLWVNRPPRLQPDQRTVRVVVPQPPPERTRPALPLLGLLLPLALGVVLWRLTGNAVLLLLSLLGPALAVGSLVSERRSGRRLRRRELAVLSAQREVAETELRAAVQADVLARRHQHPDAATLLGAAVRHDPRLWERRRHDTDALDLRLGLADLPARVQVDGPLEDGAATAHDVPLVVPLARVGVLGLAGPGAHRLARWVLVQAAVLHDPHDLSVVVLGPPERWAWTRWLPHAAARTQDCRALVAADATQAAHRVAELVAELEARQPTRLDTGSRPHVLLVVDGARLWRSVPGLARLLAEGSAVGLYAVCVDPDPLLLPSQCGATALVATTGPPDGACLVVARHGLPDLHGVADLVSEPYAEQVARALSPLVAGDTTSTDAVPARVRWTDLVGLGLTGAAGDAAAVAGRWAACGRSTTALLGRSATGPVAVDLVADGPHALVAGTTGSGKSELLQTLIASLALGNRPDELVLVLVDYKGGAAFGPCRDLPHVVGMVTDLDGTLVERALESLHAELTRREAVLAGSGAADLDEHRRRAGPGEALPRLVLIVDEFASLVEDLPAFVGGLVGIAMRGRSLGVHLVLATQRPEGVVSADVRANTNLRICLAVTRDAESRDVLDTPVAATISRATPGRAWLRTGHADLVLVQTARVGGRRGRSAPRVPTVELCPASELGSRRRALVDPGATGGSDQGVVRQERSDLDLLVSACRAAAQVLRIAPVHPPWLEPLPERMVLEPAGAGAGTQPDPHPRTVLHVGVLDVPSAQARRPLALDLDSDTHLLVLGAARSGRTTVLRTLAGSLAATAHPDDVHLYVLDLGGGALTALSHLPHTGAVVGPDEPERLARLLTWLGQQVAQRQAHLAAQGHGGLTEHRAATAPGVRLPHLVVLLDRWEAFLATYQDLDGGRLVEQVLHLLREGPSAGLHVVVTADRSGLVGRMASAVPRRLLLRMADPADYAVAGLPARLAPETLPPGRGWTLGGEPLVTQVALLDADPGAAAQAAALRRLAAAAPSPTRPPHRIAALPDAVPLQALPAAPAGRVVLGVSGDGPDVLHLDLSALGPGLLVAGPAGSGRSTVLLVLARGGHGLPVVALAPRPSPLRDLPGCLHGDDPAALRSAMGEGACLLLVDDVELLTDGPCGPLLEDLVRTARDTGIVVVTAGTTAELAGGFRGVAVALRRARTGLLLSPESAGDGDLLGLRLPRSTGGRLRPGRGLLVLRDGGTPVQVALP